MTTPTIPNGASFMAASLYTGTGGTVVVNNSNTGTTGFQPDFVWIKNRSYAQSNTLYDSVRGVYNVLVSNSTVAEDAETANHGLSAFNSNGFTLIGETVNQGGVNTSPYNYVGWQWKAGGSAVSNTNGTITSSVSANTTSGFSVVSYTGTGSAATVGHGLGAVPSMVIVKQRAGGGTSGVNDWVVSHASLTSGTYFIRLNTTAAQQNAATVFPSFPSSTVISIGTDSYVNASTGTYVAYCWAPIAGYSAFGSYTGNGSADGPFVYTGFRPRFIMIKRTDTAGDWWMYDTSRSTYNAAILYLFADSSAAEVSDVTEPIDFLSNGFKLRIATYQPNTSGGTFIYAAFAENPFKYANAR